MKDDKQKESIVQDLIEKFEQSNNKQISAQKNQEAEAKNNKSAYCIYDAP